MERLARSLEEQMKKAYWDSIEATLSEKENIDVEWLSRLYQEIPDRIIRWIKKDSDFSKEVRASFDKDLFVQMIKNDAFHGIDLLALVENTYSFIGQIQSAARDKILSESKDKILKLSQREDCTFAKLTVLFLRESHMLLDFVDEDMKSVFRNICKNKK